MKTITLICALVVSAQSLLLGDHWNQFRGPNGDGKSSATNLPLEFDEAKNVRWKIPIASSGWSSPVVWDNEIWLTTGSDESRELRAICVDLDSGKIKKDIKVFDMIERKVDPAYAHDSPHLNSPATPTSVVERDRVFVSFGSQGIACLNRTTGEQIWERRDLRIYQPVRQGSSPIVDEQNLYVAYDGTDQQFVIALDKTTGTTRWKTDRNVETDWMATLRGKGLAPKGGGGKPNDNKKSFATATLIDVDGQRQLIAPAAEATISYNPETGKELWRAIHPGGFNIAARPLWAHDMVYVFTSGLTGFLVGIRVDGSGDVTDSHVAWSTTQSTPRIPSPIIVDDLMFMVTDKGGIVRCLNAKTGEQVWRKRIGGNHWASPIHVDGKLFFTSKEGDVTVLTASQGDPEVVAKNKLNAEFIASPAVASDSLVLRSTTHLYCIANGHHRSHEQVAADVYPDQKEPKRFAKKDPKKGSKKGSADDKLQRLGARLKELVKAGKLTGDEALELYMAASGKQN